MKTVFRTLVILFISSTLFAAPIVNVDQQEGEKLVTAGTCDVSILFGSYSSGIDYKLFQKTTAFIEKSKKISKATKWSWGLEGEVSICLEIESRSVDSIYSKIKSIRMM